MKNFRNTLLCILAILLTSGFARKSIVVPGLSSPVAIGQFLNGNLPSTTPTQSGSPTAPQFLSQTGAFSDLLALTPSSGVIPYDMIEPFWSDGAAKSRWMAIPNDGTHDTAAEQIQFSNEDPWIFPVGAVLIKHFELGGQRLETRFEVKGTDDVYYYLTYKWNENETDAELLYNGLDEDILVDGSLQTWHYPSIAECADCHTNQAGNVLGPKTRHLNSDILYPSSGLTANQLVTLSFLGILNENITDETSSNYMAVAAKDDLSASLEYRARSYLDVNCSNCHQPGSINGGMFDARITTPLTDQGIIYGPLIYDEGLINPKVVIPQDVDHSMMHFRMNSLVSGIAMPPLAKSVVDADGVQLIEDWINSLTPATSSPPVALFSATPTSGTSPLTVNFDASSSTDGDGDALSYSWDFGDGSNGTGLTISHIYTALGTYDATLTVNDGQFSDFTCVSITVSNQPANPLAVSFTDNTSLLSGDNFSGVAMAISDMNGDGKDDIIRFNQAKTLNVHYQQAPSASFSSYNYGSVSSSNQWSVCIADYDHNGLNDILSGGAYDNIKLFSNNNGNNSYSQQTLGSSNIFIQGSNFADIDNDGWADIFACHDDAESRAYTNNENGTFTFDPNLISTETTPSSDNSGNYASMWTDYDNDGDLDLYISKCRIGVSSASDPRRINMLWQNDGNNNFTEVSQAANLKIGAQSWLSDFGDIDNDGDLDAIVINHYDDSNLMLNNGDGTFTDVTASSGLFPALQSGNSFGIQGLFRDFNNDGFIDLIVTGQEHYLFYNNGDGTFNQAANPFNSNDIESLAVGDLNHDGFVDVYAGYASVFNSPSSISDRLFMNDGNSNNFIAVQLQGVVSNINGIGARVELYGSWGKQIREVRSGEGYGIHNSFTQHFGIGTATSIDKIIVRWPSGIVQEVNNPVINQFLSLVEVSCSLTGPCDDGDDCTINDTYNSSCNCEGTLVDQDMDGVCSTNDPDDNDPCVPNACPSCTDVTINILLDNYPQETSWQITDSNGAIMASGGIYDTSPDGSTIIETVCLDDGCYDFIISDTYGDGICCGYGNGAYTVTDADGNTLASGGQFANSETTNFCLENSCQEGTACDDGDDCTTGDVYDVNCTCAGVYQDADSDGVCDADDVCAGFDDNLIGTACDDGDDCTTGDVYDGSCNCVGVFADADSDGVCDADDVCAGFDDNLIGTSCDDGDNCTTGDVYDGSCNCAGVFADADSDGVCDADDVCAGFDDNLIGTSCNDGDDCTTGDVYDGSCNCAGVFADADSDGVCDADDICAGFDDNLIGTACDDGDDCTTGDTYDGSCNCAGVFADADSDGVCDADDVCAGFDDNLIGTSCDDGDNCTTGDVYDGSCNCAGVFADADSDGVCDADDVCAGFDDNLIGTACNDGYDCTTGDVYDGSCNCAGVFADADSDGVCDADDVCAGFDDNLIGTSCDDGDDCTSGDIYDGSCNCVGILDDTDGDGVCDDDDVCPGFDDNLIGTSCDDGDACTTGDIYDGSCNCAGVYQDSDGDGVCDADDVCAGFDDNLIGTSCDDGDDCTSGDIYDGSCNCAGILDDADGDGVCDDDDVCPGFDDNLIGTSCDDGDACTTGDIYDGSCNCAGVYQDSDGDGVCDADDVCAGFDDNLIGTSCDDGDACTTGDTYDGSCNCVGVFEDADSDGVCDADDVCAGFDDNLIGTSCDDGDACTTGDTYDGSCNCIGVFADADSDGVCDADDVCAGFDDNLIGTACDDGDACTTGDTYDGSCNCVGVFEDADSDGVCDADDVCAGFDDNLIGTSCDDGDACTTGDTYDGSCNCIGVFADADSDGVCDADDVCAGFDDNLIGTACDDGDACTTGDTYDGSCNCVGVFEDADSDGVCDADDVCAGFDDNLIGTACDDGDACTTGDTYDGSCNCTGVFADADSDGVCDADDVCAGFDDNLIGTSCDDGDACTTGDTYDGSCNCVGTYIDQDMDGVCSTQDPDDTDPCVPVSCQTCTDVTVTILLDNYPEETSWIIRDQNGATMASGGTYGSSPDGSTISATVCLDDGCYDFVINDSYGDGVCCGYGIGNYSVTDVDGNSLAAGGQFGSSETTNFCVGVACPIGQACDDGDGCTTGETYDANCDCNGGTLTDVNNNGICDEEEGCVTSLIDAEDFEGGWGIWNDGGTDSRRSINDAVYANSGSYCFRLRDNTSGSVATTDILDLSLYEEITIDFSYLAVSMETNEDFWLQLSTNGGSSYTTFGDWDSGDEFVNNVREFESVTIQGPFTANSRLRFRCDASANADRVYFDDVTITGCAIAGSRQDQLQEDGSLSNQEISQLELKPGFETSQFDLILYPNPSFTEIFIGSPSKQLVAQEVTFDIYHISGRKINAFTSYVTDSGQIHVDVEQLVAGVYYVSIQIGEQHQVLRFIKQ